MWQLVQTHDFCHGLPEYADNLVEYCENFLIEGNCTKAKCLKKNLNIGVLQNKIRTELFKKRNKCRLCKENEGEKIGCSLLSKREKEAFGLCCFVFQRNKNCMSGKRCRYLHRIPKHLGFTEYVNNVVYRNEVAKIQKHCRLCEGSSLVEEPVIQVEVPARPGSASSSENSGRRVKLVDAPRRSSRDLLTLDAEKEDLRGVLSSQPTLVSYDVLAIEDYSINMDLCTVNGRVRAKPEDLANLLNKKVKIKQSDNLPRSLEVEEAELKVLEENGNAFVILDIRNKSSRTQPIKAGSILATAILDTQDRAEQEVYIETSNHYEENHPQYDESRSDVQHRQRSPDVQHRLRSPVVQYRQSSPAELYRQSSPAELYRQSSPAEMYRQSSKVERKLYVGNLPNRHFLDEHQEREMKSDLMDLFSKYGQIRGVQISGKRIPAKGTVEFYDSNSITSVLNNRPITLNGCRLELTSGSLEIRQESLKESAKSRLG